MLLSHPVQNTEVQELTFSANEVHETARNSLDFLAGMAMPTVFQYCFPLVFQAAWTWLCDYIHKERDFSKLALGLPRGFGKTTLMKLFILYCILFTTRKFILITCSTATLAENIIADVIDMLEEPNIKKVFGDWKLGVEKDTQPLKKFGFRGRTIMLAGIGAGGSLRGLNIKNERPDVMLFEDIQTREQADSQVQSEAVETWMIGTAMKAKSPHGCLYIFVGNMYPTKYSILRKLKGNPSWAQFIVGGILADGTSLWEELQPISQLLAEFESDLSMGRPEIFYAEVLNDETTNINSAIDLSKIPEYPYDDMEVSGGDFIIIDPSNDKANSDYVTLMYFSIIDGTPVCRRVKEGRFSPGDTIRYAYEWCFTYGATLVAVESNAYQYSLLYWFQFIGAQLGVAGIECVPVYSGSLTKNTRILNMFKELLSSELLIHPEAKSQVWHQISSFNPLRRDNTDGILDCLTYAVRVISEFGQYIAALTSLGEQEHNNVKVWEVTDNCTF